MRPRAHVECCPRLPFTENIEYSVALFCTNIIIWTKIEKKILFTDLSWSVEIRLANNGRLFDRRSDSGGLNAD